MKNYVVLLCWFASAYPSPGLHAQDAPPPIDASMKRTVVDSLSKLLMDYYILPERCPAAIAFIERKLRSPDYKAITDPRVFAERLTLDVNSILHDDHFRVRYDPEAVREERETQYGHAPSGPFPDEASRNFGFREVRILDGNIGYIDITGFHDLAYAADAVNAAMAFVKNTHAVIVDLRSNHGGASDTGPYLSAFLLGNKPELLLDMYTRDGDRTIHEQFLSAPVVQGDRLPEVDVYILTSPFTFSAAEAFAYSLQSLKRAKVVGEPTGGGAHMWTGRIVADGFYAHIPYARPIDPRTKSNWEGTGVLPDVPCRSNEALTVAWAKALESIARKEPSLAATCAWHLEAVNALMDAVGLDPELAASVTGSYGDKQVSLEAGKLYLEWKGARRELTPLRRDYFLVSGFDFFRIRFVRVGQGPFKLRIVNDDGSQRDFERTH